MIREASLNDLETLLDWRMEVLGTVFEGRKLNGLRQKNADYYQAELGSGHIACFALDPNRMSNTADSEEDWKLAVIGCGGVCLQQEMPSPDNPSGKCGYLMNIYVRPAFRHQGHAREIVEWLKNHAQNWGADKIWLEASDEGRPLYKGMGFMDLDGIMAIEPGREEERES